MGLLFQYKNRKNLYQTNNYYGGEALYTASATTKNKLERLQNEALKLVTGVVKITNAISQLFTNNPPTIQQKIE